METAPPVVPASEGGNASTIMSDISISTSKRGRVPEDAAQAPADKRPRTNPVISRSRFALLFIMAFVFFFFRNVSF